MTFKNKFKRIINLDKKGFKKPDNYHLCVNIYIILRFNI